MAQDLSKVRRIPDYMEHSANKHFKSLKDAREVEARALDGDDNAMVQMMKFWQELVEIKDRYGDHPYAMILQFVGFMDLDSSYYHRDKAAADSYRKAAIEAFHPEVIGLTC